MPDLFSNFQTVQKLAQDNQPQAQAGFVGYIYWSGAPSAPSPNEKTIRLLHDGCIVLWFHERMPFNNGKRGDVVCLQSPSIDNQRECPLCASDTPYHIRGMGLAVQREERIVGEGPSRRAMVDDRMIEIDDRDSGAKHTVPYLGTMKQGMANFWNNLVPLAYRYGTVTERDISVTRVGNDMKTSYSFLPFDPDPDMDSLDKVLERYKKVLGGRSPQDVIMTRANQMSSDRTYMKNFGQNIFTRGFVDQTQDTTPVQATPTLTVVPQMTTTENSNSNGGGTTFANLKNKLDNYSSATATPEFPEDPPF